MFFAKKNYRNFQNAKNAVTVRLTAIKKLKVKFTRLEQHQILLYNDFPRAVKDLSLKDDILKKLRESGGYISGESLAKSFSKSRAAVWKAVNSLRDEGYPIEAHTKKGYRLAENPDVLNADEILNFAENKIKVFYQETVDSTNNYAKRILADDECSEFLAVSAQQTAGRGRQGKVFYSPKGTGVYMSLVVHPDSPLQNAVSATTAAAVAVCRAIEKITDKHPGIKWVNDVFLDGKKVCGILTEAVSDFESATVSSVIIGIGINIKTSDFPDSVENGGCLGADVSRAKLVAAVSDELLKIVNGSYGDFIDYYRSRSIVIGKNIRFLENGVWKEAKAAGVDDFGGLEIILPDGELQTLRSGEISIREI